MTARPFTEDDLVRGLDGIAAWVTPAAAPPRPDPRSVVDIRRSRPHQRTWWAAAAALIAVLAAAVSVVQTPTIPPIASGSWSPMAPAPITARALAASVWTGTEVVVIGGQAGDGRYLRDAAAYNPTTDTWRRLPDAPEDVLPGARALWTGREVVVVMTNFTEMAGPGRDGVFSTRYSPPMALDPVAGAWRRLPAFDEGVDAVAVVGGQIVALVTVDYHPFIAVLRDDRWETIAVAEAPRLDLDFVREWDAVVMGSQVAFISREWLADKVGAEDPIGFLVDPATHAVQPILRPVGMEDSDNELVKGHVAATQSGALLFLGQAYANGDMHHAAAVYDAATGQWRPSAPLRRFPVLEDMLATVSLTAVGDNIVALGGIDAPSIIDDHSGDGLHVVYDVLGDRWHRLPAPHIDLVRLGHVAVWTGAELVVWGGLYERHGVMNRADTPANDGAVYRLPGGALP